jgi:hypothetical protein
MSSNRNDRNDWQAVGAVAAVGTAVTVAHGLTTKNWTTAHTVFTIVGAVAGVGAFLSSR